MADETQTDSDARPFDEACARTAAMATDLEMVVYKLMTHPVFALVPDAAGRSAVAQDYLRLGSQCLNNAAGYIRRASRSYVAMPPAAAAPTAEK